LTQTQQLREYSQRFAFVIHDIKNVSGQLSMLLTNAELYADNPEFQRDMLATVRASVGKITRLLSRLQAERQERDHALTTPAERLRDLIGASREASHRDIGFRDDARGAGAAIDPDAFDAVVTHLLSNAIDASNANTAIEVDLRLTSNNVILYLSIQRTTTPHDIVGRCFTLRTTRMTGMASATNEELCVTQAATCS
jgi:signal transduction histidine kinase